jgi:murein DD-endopeptidase MepM/ murein hydrolase activator NlpD
MGIRNVEIDRPNYNEYRYNVGEIGHNPHELMAFLTAKYQDFQYADIESDLCEIFDEQYILEFVEEIEVRYNSENEPYNYYIINIILTISPFSYIIADKMDEEQRKIYDLLMLSKGNRQYVASPLAFDWLPLVSSGYGWRISPITGAKEFHKGVDIPADFGTEIHAAHDGIVTFAGWGNSYGNHIIITGNNGFATKYAHCSSLLVGEGQTVKVGEIIALVGSTGDSTGNHLHYEVLKDSQNLNPLYFSSTNGTPIN